jgi:hypothetical protein
MRLHWEEEVVEVRAARRSFESLLGSASRSATPPTASGVGRHISPHWELWSNLRLLCGNVNGMSGVQAMAAKTLVFTGCCG